MNETMQVLMNRKSVRVFEDKEIAPEIKEAILAAAMRAPTAGNMMLYSIIDVTDPAIDVYKRQLGHRRLRYIELAG